MGVDLDRQDRGIGAALLDRVLSDITEQARSNHVREVEVIADVHKLNGASRALLTTDGCVVRIQRNGTGKDNSEENYDVWGTTLEV
jgi:hypothetical protein